MKANKVLITGGLGFIGTHTAKLLVEQGLSVVLLDNLNPQTHGAVPEIAGQGLLQHPRVEVYRGDVRSPADWETALAGVGQVVHLAAETGTLQSMYEVSRYTETNVGGTAALLDHLANRRHTVTKLVLASSRAVYGEGAYGCPHCGTVYPPMRSEAILDSGKWEPPCPACRGPIESEPTPEDAKLAPTSVYAATKVAQEDLVRITSQALGIPAVILRMQNVYGEGQSLKNPYTGVVSIFSNQLRLGKTLKLYEDGQESRDFVHVSDVACAVAGALASAAGDGCTLNVGSGCATTMEQVARMLQDSLGCKAPPVVSHEYRLADVRHARADLREIQARFGFYPVVSIQEGLARFAEWVKTQPVERDQFAQATQELMERGLMREIAPQLSRDAPSD